MPARAEEPEMPAVHAAPGFEPPPEVAPGMPRAPRSVLDQSGEAERVYAMFQHLAGLLALATGGVLLMGTPVLGLIAAVVMWRVRAATSEFLDDHGREAVNFQISLMIYGLALAIPGLSWLWFALALLCVIGCVRGAIAANRGEYYRYPACIRIIPAQD